MVFWQLRKEVDAAGDGGVDLAGVQVPEEPGAFYADLGSIWS